jgi:hypothetical protein
MDTIDDYYICGPYRIFGYDKDTKVVHVSYKDSKHGFTLYKALENKLLGAEIKNGDGGICRLCEHRHCYRYFCDGCYLRMRDSKISKLDVIPRIIDDEPYQWTLRKSVIYCLKYSVCKPDESGLQTDTYIISHFACEDKKGTVKHKRGIYSMCESSEYLKNPAYIRDPVIVAVISRKVLRRMMIFREYGLINDVFLVILWQWIALEN